MKSDQTKWDKIYANEKHPSSPSPVVTAFSHFANIGTAADIAAGNGRNANYLAKEGFTVDAIDISEVGLNIAEKGDPKIRPIRQDLDYYIMEYGRYDLIVNVNFLNRRLFPYIVNALKPKGVLIFQTFLWDQAFSKGKSQLPNDHYLLPNELLHTFLTLHVHHYSEEECDKPRGDRKKTATLIAQRRQML